MIASVQTIERFIESKKEYERARSQLLYGYDGPEEVYALLGREAFCKVAKVLGKRLCRKSVNGVESAYFEHNGCVFYATGGGDAA